MISKRLPVTVITGFLGSGKTTVLRHLLTNSRQRLAVMVNEFGSVGLDGDLIRSCGFCPDEEIEGRLVELNNGCLCCTVQDDFLPTMEKILSQSSQLDGIVIETSGLALPRPLINALEWPAVRTKVFLNGVITLVDGEAISGGNPVSDLSAIERQRQEDPNLDHLTPVNELFHDQLRSADFILISRADRISKSQIENIESELTEKSTLGTPILSISHGKVSPDLILGLKTDDLITADKSAISDDSLHDDIHHDDHHHVQVSSGIVKVELLIDKGHLESILPKLAVKYKILRLKGRCWFPDKTIPLQIQMVGSRLSSWYEPAPDRVWKPTTGGLDLVVLSFRDDAAAAIQHELDGTV
mgnify:CR=1 FL=1